MNDLCQNTIMWPLAAMILSILLLGTSCVALQPVHYANKCHRGAMYYYKRPASCRIPKLSLQFVSDSNIHGASADDDSDLFDEINNGRSDSKSISKQKEMLSELEWRSKKVSLEEANTKRFHKVLKSKPWKLPIDQSRQWIHDNFGCETKEEFFDLVANGNLRTPYIPKDPEKYYSEKGTWISWKHFLSRAGGAGEEAN